MTAKRRRAPGEGSVFRLKNGKWRAQVRISLPDGKVKPITKTCRLKTEAVEALGKLKRRAARIGASYGDAQTLGDYLDAWRANRKAGGQIRASTFVEEARHIGRIKTYLGSTKLVDLERRHVRFLLAELEGGPLAGKRRTVEQIYSMLRKALNDAVRDERLDRSPCDHVHPPKASPKEIQYLSREDIQRILKAVDETTVRRGAPDLVFSALIHLLVFSGMRIGEALALTWRQVDFKTSTITIDTTLKDVSGALMRHRTKTGVRRVIKISAPVLLRLKQIRGSTIENRRAEISVFRSASGGPLRQSNLLRRRWHPLLKRLKLELGGFHRLRHSHASLLIAEGTDLVTVANRLGHADSTTTLKVYAHPFQDRDAAAADAFESLVS